MTSAQTTAVADIDTVTDRLLLADAERVLTKHRPGPTGRCVQPHCHQCPWPCTAAVTAQRAAAIARGQRPPADHTRWTITDAAHRLPVDAQLPRLAADVLDNLYWFPTAPLAAIARRSRTTLAALQQTLAQLCQHGLVRPLVSG